MPLQEELEEQGQWLFKYRGVIPVFIFVIGFGLYVYMKYNPDKFYFEETDFENVWFYLCFGISLFGLLIRVITIGATPPNTSGRNTKEQVADTLNTKGLYSIVRHPLYLGNFFMWLGPAMLLENFWFLIAFVFLFMLYYERIMFAEEQFLRRKFGERYLNWATRTPAFFPSFKNFEKTQLIFCWKKVLKNEKTGIMLLFVVFAVMHVTGQLIQKKGSYDFLIIGLGIVSILYYVVVKIISKQTNLLNVAHR